MKKPTIKIPDDRTLFDTLALAVRKAEPPVELAPISQLIPQPTWINETEDEIQQIERVRAIFVARERARAAVSRTWTEIVRRYPPKYITK